MNTHTRPRTLSRWPSGPAKSRPTTQWLSGYVTKSDGGINEPTVRTTWAVPESDRTARIARSKQRTATERPRHRNGRPGFSLRGWTRIYPRMLLLDGCSARCVTIFQVKDFSTNCYVQIHSFASLFCRQHFLYVVLSSFIVHHHFLS
jgi:hypothetical protein